MVGNVVARFLAKALQEERRTFQANLSSWLKRWNDDDPVRRDLDFPSGDGTAFGEQLGVHRDTLTRRAGVFPL